MVRTEEHSYYMHETTDYLGIQKKVYSKETNGPVAALTTTTTTTTTTAPNIATAATTATTVTSTVSNPYAAGCLNQTKTCCSQYGNVVCFTAYATLGCAICFGWNFLVNSIASVYSVTFNRVETFTEPITATYHTSVLVGTVLTLLLGGDNHQFLLLLVGLIGSLSSAVLFLSLCLLRLPSPLPFVLPVSPCLLGLFVSLALSSTFGMAAASSLDSSGASIGMGSAGLLSFACWTLLSRFAFPFDSPLVSPSEQLKHSLAGMITVQTAIVLLSVAAMFWVPQIRKHNKCHCYYAAEGRTAKAVGDGESHDQSKRLTKSSGSSSSSSNSLNDAKKDESRCSYAVKSEKEAKNFYDRKAMANTTTITTTNDDDDDDDYDDGGGGCISMMNKSECSKDSDNIDCDSAEAYHQIAQCQQQQQQQERSHTAAADGDDDYDDEAEMVQNVREKQRAQLGSLSALKACYDLLFVLQSCYVTMISLFVTVATSFYLFPNIWPLSWRESPEVSDLLVGSFQAGEVVGRFAPVLLFCCCGNADILVKPSFVGYIALTRLVVVAAIYAILVSPNLLLWRPRFYQRGSSLLSGYPVIQALLLLFLSVSHGTVATLSCISVSQSVGNPKLKVKAATFGLLALLAGIAFGNVLSLLISAYY